MLLTILMNRASAAATAPSVIYVKGRYATVLVLAGVYTPVSVLTGQFDVPVSDVPGAAWVDDGGSPVVDDGGSYVVVN